MGRQPDPVGQYEAAHRIGARRVARARQQVLQVACVYGDFSNQVADHLDKTGSRLEIVDVAPIQLDNVEKKLTGKKMSAASPRIPLR